MTNEELTLWIEENHKFIRNKANFWAKNYPCLEMTYEEAYSLALEYVFRSSLKFDKSKGYKFSTYCGMAIDNAFKGEIRSIQNQKKYVTYEISLNNIISDSDGNITEQGDLIEDITINIEEEVIANRLCERVREIIDKEVKRGGIILDLLIEGYTQRDIGKKLGISQASCSRLIHKISTITKKELSK